MKKEYSAGFIIYKQAENHPREYLLLHYPSGHFDFPKGHLEGDEQAFEAAKRELFEETGLQNIEVIADFEVAIEYSFRHQGQPITKQVTFFLAKSNDTEVKISHEHQDSIWLPYNKALEKVTFSNARDVLQKAEQKLKSLTT